MLSSHIKDKDRGLFSSETKRVRARYYDGASEKKRENYVKRHGAGQEDWNNPMSAGFWSRWVLWEKKGREETEKFLRSKLKPARVSVYLTNVDVREAGINATQKVVKSPVKGASISKSTGM